MGRKYTTLDVRIQTGIPHVPFERLSDQRHIWMESTNYASNKSSSMPSDQLGIPDSPFRVMPSNHTWKESQTHRILCMVERESVLTHHFIAWKYLHNGRWLYISHHPNFSRSKIEKILRFKSDDRLIDWHRKSLNQKTGDKILYICRSENQISTIFHPSKNPEMSGHSGPNPQLFHPVGWNPASKTTVWMVLKPGINNGSLPDFRDPSTVPRPQQSEMMPLLSGTRRYPFLAPVQPSVHPEPVGQTPVAPARVFPGLWMA